MGKGYGAFIKRMDEDCIESIFFFLLGEGLR